MAHEKLLYAEHESGLLAGGPHTDVVRRRVLEQQAGAGNGAPVVVPDIDLAHALANERSVPEVLQSWVPVQVAFPGRLCQRCDRGPDQQLATMVRASSTGQGTDFFCVGHATPDCTHEVPTAIRRQTGA